MIRQNRPVQPGDPIGSTYVGPTGGIKMAKSTLQPTRTIGGPDPRGITPLSGAIQPTGAQEAYQSGQNIIGAPVETQTAQEYDVGTTEFLKRNPIPEEAPEWFTKQVEQQKQYWDPSWGPFEHESWEEMGDPAKAHMMRELGPYDEREYTNPNAVMMPPVPMGPGIVEPMPMGPIGPMMDPDRISEIVAQQRAAGVPEEGLITNFNFAQTPPAIPLAERMQAARARGIDPRMARSYKENIRLMGDPRMHPPIGVVPPPPSDGWFASNEGLSGQEYAEKHGIPYARGGLAQLSRPGYATGEEVYGPLTPKKKKKKKKKKEEPVIDPNYIPSTLEEILNAIDIEPRASGSFTEGAYGPENEQRTWSDLIGGTATVDLPGGFTLKGDYDKRRIKDRLYSPDDKFLDERVRDDHDRWKLELLLRKKFGGPKNLNQGGLANILGV
jgi:hypothetical protein